MDVKKFTDAHDDARLWLDTWQEQPDRFTLDLSDARHLALETAQRVGEWDPEAWSPGPDDILNDVEAASRSVLSDPAYLGHVNEDDRRLIAALAELVLTSLDFDHFNIIDQDPTEPPVDCGIDGLFDSGGE